MAVRRLKFLAVLAIALSSFAAQAAIDPHRLIVRFAEPPLALRGRLGATSDNELSLARFRSDLSRIEAASPDGGSQIRREFFRTFRGVSVEVSRIETVSAIAKLPYVTGVYPDLEVEAFAITDVKASQSAGSVSYAATGAGVVVAIIDSGIDYNHPALAGKMIGGYDFVNGDEDPMDDNRHGTHVAGIVAARGEGFSGLAPNAALLIYKVLDANGKGRQSDIIAAIERAVDPNGDGNLSDHADVANLSLGTRGSPEDPVAQAVDAAAAAGVVIVAASGNDGLFHAVGSPAIANGAIAVGASDGEGGVADFTNRGPAPRSGAIKPDVLAPGVSIRSTALGGGTLVLSGTSMAAPYVSALAALIIEEHPQWTPERIKSAIVSTATHIADQEVMNQGSGLIDVDRALAASTAIAPTQLNFGLYELGAGWTRTRSILIANTSATARSFAITATSSSEAVAIMAPATIELRGGESQQLDITIAVDNQKLGDIQSPSFAFGGFVTLKSPEETLTIPWAFLKAGRAVVTFDREFPLVAWPSAQRAAASFAFLGPYTVETLLTPGIYDLIVTALSDDGLRLIIDENRTIAGDVTIALKTANATNAIKLDGRDVSDAPFPNGSTQTAMHVIDARLLFTSAGSRTSLELPRGTAKTIFTSSFSDRYGLLLTETFIDGAAHHMYVVQHDLLSGVYSSKTVTKRAADLQSRDVRVQFPSGSAKRELGILARGEVRRADENGRGPIGLLTRSDADIWIGTLSMTPEVHPDYGSGVQLYLYTGQDNLQGLPSSVTPTLRLTTRGFTAARPFDAPPLPIEVAANDRFDFAMGPNYVLATMSAIPQGWVGTWNLYGQRNDIRNLDRVSMTYRVVDRARAEVASGRGPLANPFFIELPAPDAYHVQFVAPGSVLDMDFDTRADGTPPTLTSLAIQDDAGRTVSRLMQNGRGKLVFSIADFHVGAEKTEYRSIDVNNPRVYFERRGATMLTQLPIVYAGEDAGDSDVLGRTAVGRIYQADLTNVLRLDGDIILRFEFSDRDGNSVVYVVDPAFNIVPAPTRRRAVRR